MREWGCLGAEMGLCAYDLLTRAKYRHNGGMTFVASYRDRVPRGNWGSMMGTFGPLFGTSRSCRFAGIMS